MLPLLVPLQTLPSWPEAPVPTTLEALLLFLLIPLAISVPLVALVMGPEWAGRRRGDATE